MSHSFADTNSGKPARRLKVGLLLFWAAWLTVVFATNLCDGLKQLGVLGPDWAFASGNYDFVAATTSRYGTPAWLNGLLFAGVIAWEAAAALLFWRAAWDFPDRRFLYPAFGAGLGLWAAFAVTDEVFIAYAVEGTHLRLFTAQLATLLAVELLPESGAAR